MVDKNILSVDENLRRIREEDKIRSQELITNKLNRKKKNKRKRKGIIISSIALLLAFATGLTSCIKRKTGYESPKNTITKTMSRLKYEFPENIIVNTQNDNKIETSSLANLGVELEFQKEDKKEYSSTSGNINVNNIVEDENGTTWVDQEAESKKDEVGKVVTDTQGGTLEIKPDGDVYEKDPSYQIVDDNGNVKEEGKLDDDGIPAGYAWDSVIEKYIPEDEVGKYVKDSEGNIWLKEDYEAYLKSLETEETTKTETEFIPMEPVIVEEITSEPVESAEPELPEESESTTPIPEETEPSTGYYYDEISGLTFQSKEHYDQWVLQDFEGYGIINGIMVPKTDEMIKADEKVLKK